MRKKRIFIGSSSEELKLAESAKKILEPEFDVTIWNDNVWDTAVFKINNNFLHDLLKATLQFDFGILLGTTDDKVIVREQEMLQSRDNILFELGLFMGRLGLSKCAFVVEKELKILSDIKGISLARFSKKKMEASLMQSQRLLTFLETKEIRPSISFLLLLSPLYTLKT